MSFEGNKKLLLIAAAFVIAYVYSANFIFEPMNLSPFYQFLTLTLFPAAIFSLYVGKIAMDDGIRRVVGIFSGYLAIDLMIPPYMINLEGVYASGTKLYAASVDVQAANFFSGLGVSGQQLFIATYFIMPILLVAISAYCLDGDIEDAIG